MKTNYDRCMFAISVLLGCAAIASVIIKHYFEIETIIDYILILAFALPCIFDFVLYYLAYREIQYENLILLAAIIGLAVCGFFVPEVEGDPLVLLLQFVFVSMRCQRASVSL